jgi:hypothetical protein
LLFPGLLCHSGQIIIPLDVVKAIIAIATDCEGTNQEMEKRFRRAQGSRLYFRFNVDQGLQNIRLDEWERLAEVSGHTSNYMKHQEVTHKLEGIVKVLKAPVGVL